MATKRKHTKRAPAKKHRAAPKKKTNPSRKAAATRRSTKRHTRRSVRRTHNPSDVALQVGGVIGGSMATNVVASYANNAFPQLASNPLVRIASKAAIAWGLGYVVSRFAPASLRSAGKFVALGGYANAATDAINYFVPSLQTIFLPGGGAPVQVAQNAQPGMADIVTLDAGSDDPYYGATPSFAGMNDVVTLDDQMYS